MVKYPITEANNYSTWNTTPIPNGNIVNSIMGPWMDLNPDEDYSNFYKELYPTEFNNPIFNIHLNVDYPFNLTNKV